MTDATRTSTSTRGGILRPDQLARFVHLERSDCSSELAPWVENYWMLRWDLPVGTRYVSSTLPHPACNLSVERGHVREGVGDDPVVVTGVITRRFDVDVQDTGWVAGVKFRPGGLSSLAGLNARELRDVTTPARRLLPAATVDALAELGPEQDDDTLRQSLDRILAGLPRPADPDYESLLAVIGLMLEDRELVRVAQVEERCSISTRSLQRLFEKYVGVSPKWVLARYRIHDAVADLDAGYAGSLADLAARYGWFDQAHFTREFTDLVGVPPRTYQR